MPIVNSRRLVTLDPDASFEDNGAKALLGIGLDENDPTIPDAAVGLGKIVKDLHYGILSGIMDSMTQNGFGDVEKKTMGQALLLSSWNEVVSKIQAIHPVLFSFERYDEPMYSIETQCPRCHKISGQIVVPVSAWVAWSRGTNIQTAFPMLGANDRELIKTGICSACWDTMKDTEG